MARDGKRWLDDGLQMFWTDGWIGIQLGIQLKDKGSKMQG